MDRRKFLGRAAAAAVGGIVVPTIIPASALGKNGYTAPSDRILMAAIGVGSMGKGNMTNFVKQKDVQFVAVCDLDKKHMTGAKNAINKFYGNKDCEAFEDYREMLDEVKFDAASIAVPDHWHALIYTDVAKRKIDVYGEKPLVRKIYEGQKVVDAVQSNGIVWQTGSWQRSTEKFRRACELVANGAIGTIKKVEVGLPNLGDNRVIGMPPVQDPPEDINYDKWLGPVAYRPFRGVLHWDWRWILDFSGGQLTDWCGHHVDIALWSLGLDNTGPIEVSGVGVYKENNLFDVPFEFNIDMTFENGLPMKIANASQLTNGMGVTWYGDEGWIHVSRKNLSFSNPVINDFKVPAGGIVFPKSEGGHHRNFLDCVKSRALPLAHVEAANRAISAGLLGEIAMMTGETIKWNPKSQSLVGASQKAENLLSRDYRKPYKL